MYLIDSLPQLNLGRIGENDVTEIEIDVSEWLTDYPAMTFAISMIAPGGSAPFLVTGVTETEGVLTWVVGAEALQVSGSGTIVIGGSLAGVEKRSARTDVFISQGHIQPDGTPVEYGVASDDDPLMDGTAAPGVSFAYSRKDHVHPADTTKAALIRLAPEYSAGSTYALGVFVSLASTGLFYECTSAIAMPEAWTAGHWTARTIGYVLAALATSLAGKATAAQGVPSGGSAGQALIKGSAANYDAAWGAVGRTNPNLLINWDWETPVNQRNATGAVSSAYCIDRWIGNGTVTPSAGNHVALGNGTTMIQRMDILPAKLYGKTVTASVDIDGTIQSATLTFPSSATGAAVSQALTGVTAEIAFIDLGSGNTTPLENVASRYIPYVKFTATAAINVRRVKLELGTATTLAQSAPERYADVLKTCQRYYRVFTEVAFIIATTSYCTLNLQYDMRKDAALTIQQFLSGDHTSNTATLVTTTAASTNLTVVLVQNANTDVRYAQYVRLNAEL